MTKNRASLFALTLASCFCLTPLAHSADSYAVLTNPEKPHKAAVGICALRVDGTEVDVRLNAAHLKRGHMYTVWGNFGDGPFHLDGNMAGDKAHEFSGSADTLPEDSQISLTLVSHGRMLDTAEAMIDQITHGPGSDPGCNGPDAPRECKTIGTCSLDIPMQ